MHEHIIIHRYMEEEIDPDLDLQIRDYLIRIFPEWSSIFEKKRSWHDARPIFTELAFRDNELIGHIAIVERTISTSWNFRYIAASFQGVSIHPDYRKQGYGKDLLKQTLSDCRMAGYPYAILFCKEPLVPYYEANGWKLPEDSMIMWKDRSLPIQMRSNCPMYQEISTLAFPEGPIDVHNPFDHHSHQ